MPTRTRKLGKTQQFIQDFIDSGEAGIEVVDGPSAASLKHSRNVSLNARVAQERWEARRVAS